MYEVIDGFDPIFFFLFGRRMSEFVRVKLLQVDFGSQSAARDPYCAVSIKEAVADAGKQLYLHLFFPIFD